MIFKKLSVQHFKRLKNATFDLAPGINIIKGDNETGKSTVKLAFLTALFASPRSEASARDIKTWGTDIKSRVTLNFETDSNGYGLSKDFQEKEVLLVDGKNKRRHEDASAVQKIIADNLGIGSQALFESTAYIDHTMVSDINKGRKEIHESLGASLTGAGEDASAQQITKKLDKIISDMEKGLLRPTTKPGVIRTLKDEIRALEEKIADLKKKALEVEKASIEFEKIVAEHSLAAAERDSKKALFESNKRYYELKDSEGKFRRQYEELEHRIDGVKQDEKKLGDIGQQLGSLGIEQKAVPNWVIFAAAGAAILVLPILLAALNIRLVLLSLFSIPLFLYSAILYKKRMKIIEKEAEAERLLNEKKVIKASIEGKLGTKKLPDLEREWSDTRRKLKDVEDELSDPEMKAVKIAPEEFHKLASRLSSLEERLSLLAGRKAKGEGYFERIDLSESQISEAEEELEAKQEELERQARKLEVYKLTRDAITEAFSRTISPARDVLKQKVAEYFKLITGGRYSEVDIEEGTLEFKVLSPEKNDWVSVSQKDGELSRGTIDQFFLAARLALVDVVSGGKKPPIFLDDPFVTFDDKRLARAMGLLKEVSGKNQIFIFTCKDSYDKWADNTVKIPL